LTHGGHLAERLLHIKKTPRSAVTLPANSALRGQPAEAVAAAIVSIREALAAHLDGASVRLPGAMWLVSSAPA
jgi:hypothetical protein